MRGIDPRTSCMQSERSTIWATSLYFSSFKLASERNSSNISFLFVTRCQIFSHYLQKQTRIVESSKMFQRCGASTPYLSHAKRALYHLRYIPVLFKLRVSFWTKFMKNSFPFVTSCQFLPNITNWKTELSNPKKCFGDAGRRSPYLSPAKRALYHLSYIPAMILLRASFSKQFMKNQLSICNELSIPSHHRQIQTRIVESSKMFWGMRVIDPRTSHMLSERSTIWDTSPYSSSFEVACEQNS